MFQLIERPSHVAFIDTGAAVDQQFLEAVNKRTVRQAHNLVAADTSVGMIINVFYSGFIAEPGIKDRTFDPPVLPAIPFSPYQNVRCLSDRHCY
jgi:hypothetical protein